MTQTTAPTDLPFTTMFGAVRHWAVTTPDAPALVVEGAAPLTYRGLHRSITALGDELATLGIGGTDRVAVLHAGGAEMARTILGVWSHATAAPLNPNYTFAEFAVYLRDLGVKALLIQQDMDSPARDAARRLALPVIEIAGGDLPNDRPGSLAGDPVGPAVASAPARPDDVALLLTTSGTTSHSKIVPIRHRQLIARCRFAAGRLGLRPSDRCLNLMPLYHSHGVNSGLGVSVVGGGSVIPMAPFNVEDFYRYLDTMAPSWFTAVFTFHHQIHAHASRYRKIIDRSRLRFIHTSSGRLDPGIAEDLEVWFDVPVIGTYASTETGVMTGDSPPPARRKRGSVGTSAGADVAIFDPDFKRLPAGAHGEVCVRGPNVFEGYENDPAATAAALRDGWFRTGDEGQLDDDGFLFLTGRVKEIINRGGEKVSPSEVDAAILQFPGVATAATFAIPHDTLGEEVAAAVVPTEGTDVAERDLAAHLRSKLSGFKVPRRILIVDEIPLSASGKVQRHALAAAFGLERAVGDTRAASGADDRQPTPMERRLQTLWSRALDLPTVGLDDDFFMLGGDSLKAVELFLAIEETLGRRLPRSVLFEANTVAEMAKHIGAATTSDCLIPIQTADSRPPFFCVHDLYGEVLIFRALAQHLGPDQPFYGLRTVGLDGVETPLSRIEDMAARYVAAIRRVQPSGPYYLGGYSMGGLVAYEMAQQLRTAGETVGLLALLDTYLRLGKDGERLTDWSVPVALRPGNPVGGVTPRYLRGAAIRAQTLLWRRLFGTAWRLCETAGLEIPRPMRRPIAANLLAIRSYRVRSWEGDAVLFKGTPYEWDGAKVRDDWRRVVRGTLEVRPITGLHHEILDEPHVRTLAASLRACLDARMPQSRPATTPAKSPRQTAPTG